jgi:HEAT repeat protein
MPPDSDLHNRIAAALTGLVKQIKAVRYYPAKHPALQTTAEESLRTFQPLLEGARAFSLTIRKEGFLFDDHPIGKTNQALAQLATFCFARRIKYLTILGDLSATDLHRFIHFLNLDPQEILRHGGIQTILEKGHVTTIWVNEQDLDAILERKEELEAQPVPEEIDLATVLAEGETSDQPEQQGETVDLQKLLKLLQQERDDNKFQQYLQEMIPLLRLNLKEEGRPQVLQAFFLLCQCATSKKLSEARRDTAMQGLGQLATDDVTTYLIAYLVDEKTNDKARKALMQVLGFLKEKVVAQLMETLAVEKAAGNRKLLSEVLILTGLSALPILQEHLLDERWYVVRNAVAIIGEIRNQESLPHLTPLLQHEDVRVRRETIRALTKIGGERAIGILLQTAESKDQDLRRQALISLGAIRATTAVPTLLKLAQQTQWNQKAMEVRKDAIRALGEIRSSEAVKDLCAILRKRRLWRRALNDELRVNAATALGEIGDEESRKILESATNDRAAAVARAAAQAIKQLDKAGQ